MPRIRTIKPEFWSSPATAKAHPVARLTYIAMWNWADDYGRGTANFKELEGFVFPNDEVDELSGGKFRKFRDVVAEVQRTYKVTFYECDDRMFYEIPSWDDHQKTERRAKARIPDPADGRIVDLTTGNTVNPGTSATVPLNFLGSAEELQQSPPTGKGTGEREKEHTPQAERVSGYSDEFEAFWKVYPRKKDKKQAFGAWKAATKRATPETITSAARLYARDCRGKEEQYIKHGKTWLNADAWDDYGAATTITLTSGVAVPEWSKDECDTILGGPDYWSCPRPPEGLNLQAERDWKRARAAEHLNERRQKAMEVMNRDAAA